MPQVFVDVMISGISVDRPRSVLVRQAEYCHDVASFTVMTDLLSQSIGQGDAVQMQWGRPQRTQTFLGYVHHTEPLHIDSRESLLKVVCIGSSYVFRQALQRVWANRTADNVVQTLAFAGLLSADVEPHTYVWPVLAATGGSVWDFLVSLAEKVGYTLWVNGTEVTFISLTAAVRRSYRTAPAFTFTAGQALSGENVLSLFRPVLGSIPEGAVAAQRQVTGVDPRTADVVTGFHSGSSDLLLGSTQTLPAQRSNESDIVSHSPEEAAVRVEAQAALNRFPYRANAEAQGDARVTQGITVYLKDLGPDNSGFWYVLGVEHVLDQIDRTYEMYLTLGRDSKGVAGFPVLADRRQFVYRSDSFGERRIASPPSTFVNGLWRSAWARPA